MSNIVFLVYCFFVFLVFPLNWDRLGSHKIAQKIAQNLNFGEDFARNHCKTQCFCIIFCMKNISQEHPFWKYTSPMECLGINSIHDARMQFFLTLLVGPGVVVNERERNEYA